MSLREYFELMDMEENSLQTAIEEDEKTTHLHSAKKAKASRRRKMNVRRKNYERGEVKAFNCSIHEFHVYNKGESDKIRCKDMDKEFKREIAEYHAESQYEIEECYYFNQEETESEAWDWYKENVSGHYLENREEAQKIADEIEECWDAYAYWHKKWCDEVDWYYFNQDEIESEAWDWYKENVSSSDEEEGDFYVEALSPEEFCALRDFLCAQSIKQKLLATIQQLMTFYIIGKSYFPII